MNPVAPLLFLPTLHPDVPPHAFPAALTRVALHLWPGQPGMPDHGYWLPSRYPFAPAQAAACLADMQAMSEAALSGVPLQALIPRDARPESLREREEARDLAQFAHAGAAPGLPPEAPDEQPLRAAAQKTLLWAWLLEERSRELRELTRGYGAQSARLAESLGAEYEDEALPGLSALHAALPEEQGIQPPWRLVLENAAIFLPPNCTLLCNSPAMRADVQDALSLSPLPAAEAHALGLDDNAAAPLRHVQAPLWRILGRAQARPQSPWLDAQVRCLFAGGTA